MRKFLLKRLLLSIPVFIGITIFVFVLSNLAPGNPAEVLAASIEGLTEEGYEQLKISLGLDKPVFVRYLIWLKDLLHGDLGISTRTNQPVIQMLKDRLGPSLILTMSSLVVSLVISIPLGVVSACKQKSIWDYFSSILAFFGASAPNFFVSLVLIYFVAVKCGLLPASGMYNSGENPNLPSLIRHLILPMNVLVLQLVGSFIKQTKGSVLDVLHEDYIKTARAKGIRESAVVVRHAFRNALIPIVTSIGLRVPFLVGGAVITEQIFAWPGIGSLMVSSINTRDYNTIMGVTVLISGTVIVVNILLDCLYTIIDPRISRN